MSLLRLRWLLVVHAVVSTPAAALADSWKPPETRAYLSKNGAFRFTVEPRRIASTLDFLRDSVQKIEPAGQAPGHTTACTGRLERRTPDGGYEKVWEARLQNGVAPVEAIVSDSGRFVATFNDWHFMGYGRNAVVIYASDGSLIRQLSLVEFLTQAEIKELPRTTSSIWWGSDHYFDQDRLLVLRVAKGPSLHSGLFRTIELELPDARVSRPAAVLEEIAEQRSRCDWLGRADSPIQACHEQLADEEWCALCMSAVGQPF